MPRDRSTLTFLIAFAVIGLGFLASTFYAETRSSAIDEEVTSVAKNSMPSVTHLVAARGALRHLEVAAERLARTPPAQRDVPEHSLVVARTELDDAIRGELETPDYAGEREAADVAQRDVRDLERLLDGWERAPADEGAAADVEVHAAVDRADEALERWLAVNTDGGRKGVRRIIEIREHSMAIAMALDVACLALTIAAAMVAMRALRRRQEVEEANAKSLVERADELELFAKRVAHDLLSPLSALTYSLHAFKAAGASDPKLKEALGRAKACVVRAQTMVDGIFEFARSGASPVTEGRASVREAIDGVVEAVKGSETEVVVLAFEDAHVACSNGVLLSILDNLVRNAVKFMSDSSLKRVTLRVTSRDESVHIDVEDTGPGVPGGMEARIFDAYVRADGVTQPGLGLGLATVKRLCEAYGGRVGVTSTAGSGSTFWFELPRRQAA
jgi:signal transduction histidine kinase